MAIIPAKGKNVKDYDMEALRNQVSVVLQNNVLFSGSILDNLRWGKKDATQYQFPKPKTYRSSRRKLNTTDQTQLPLWNNNATYM